MVAYHRPAAGHATADGHTVTVSEVWFGISTQGMASCTCGWSRQDVLFHTTADYAEMHARWHDHHTGADRISEVEEEGQDDVLDEPAAVGPVGVTPGEGSPTPTP